VWDTRGRDRLRSSFGAHIRQSRRPTGQGGSKASDRDLPAEVKEHAKYNEMSLWAQHKAVKKCVADMLAKH
jgi:stress-induced morphogen